ncbi:trypsin-like serine peptidase [Streptosporangium sp. CA-115845]|uniref:trypsin-like serine peptidase n=1 Tax=Streptosporangium sp. CA-115845 TaxID=3240071 RepID=UPI003D902095
MRNIRMLLGTLLVAGTLAALPAPANASDEPTTVDSVQLDTPESIRASWTPERMARAKPKDIVHHAAQGAPVQPVEAAGREVTVAGAAPARPPASSSIGSLGFFATPTVGKIFGVDSEGRDFSCSAAAVPGPARNVITTAAHCVHDGPGLGWARQLTYMPYYNNQPDPWYGSWTVAWMHVYQGWSQQGNDAYDYAFASVWPRGDGAVLGDVTGFNGMSFNRSSSFSGSLWGYPSIAPSWGGWQYNCSDTILVNFLVQSSVDDCPQISQHGASGGPWMYDYQNERMWGYVTTVTSEGEIGGTVYGPYFGNNAKRLWEIAGERGANQG